MKCAYYQKQKNNRLTTESKKRLKNIVNDFMTKSFVVGPEKALEIMKEEQTNKEEEDNNE